MYKKIIAVLFLSISSASHAADETDYIAFFDEYQRLLAEFDSSVNKLYSDDAKIMGAREKPDGTEESMTIDGSRWKKIIVGSMERAKQLGDRSEYSDVVVEVAAKQAKISATRSSLVDCFIDKRFYLVVESGADDQLQIVEQFSETAAQSNCKGSETDLPEFLQTTAEMINDQLPAAIDAETQLIKVLADGTNLTYLYLLTNYTSKTLTTDQATTKLQPLVLQQSCSSPNLRPILDQNGSVSYIYRGADAVQIVRFDVDKTACAG